MSDAAKKSYGQILKSSALIGGSTAINMAFGIIRTKAMAMLLGTAGYGYLGIYSSISDLVRSLAGLGINSSGVRQIAEAVGSGDSKRIACTITTLRKVALYSGALGALMLVLLSKPIAAFSFKDYGNAGQVALLALVAFFGDISAAQAALVQGMRRIADLAKMNVMGSIYGTVFSILIVWRWKEQGLVPSLICVAFMSVITSWWYARKVEVDPVPVGRKEILNEAGELLKLGLVFMVSGLSIFAAGYLVRIIVLRKLGAPAAGFYQAAWTLSTLYIGFILQAMGADFYPRLTAVANRKAECNQLVNEQSEIGLLMAAPGIMGTLTFAPLVISLFYTPAFTPAAGVLQWLCLGMLMKVLTWPMGFIVLARGERKIFFWSELLTYAAYVLMVWLGVNWMGVQGAGFAFFALYAVYCFVVYGIVHKLTGFRWSKANIQLALIFLPLVAIVFAGTRFLPPWPATLLGLVVTLSAGIYSLRTLFRLVPLERMPGPAKKILRLFKITAANPIEP